jgi:cytochrome oxidase Cu insertion factor (SCO1/SenC/PrrC family)
MLTRKRSALPGRCQNAYAHLGAARAEPLRSARGRTLRLRKPANGVVVPALACLVLGGLGGVGTALVTESPPKQELVRFTVPHKPAPHFRLRDESGAWRTPASARGEVLVVTFIYTRCRDLCPRQAAEIKEAVLGAGGGVQVYAVTVDPEHDTPEQARAWLKRMGVAGGPVHILLGRRQELAPVWDEFGIVPLVPALREGAAPEPPGGAISDREREQALARRTAPAAAFDPYPALGDGSFRGHPRHVNGLDYEHSAYALLIDKHGRQRVGFPYEQITSEILLADLVALKAES